MSPLAAATLIGGRFRLERELARGGMGSVWVAHNEQLGAPVAIKVLSAVSSPETIARFEREARAAAQLQSQHVVQVFEHGMHGGLPYIVMELLVGEDLRQCFKREGRLSVLRTARILGDVCKALRRAHESGIVHRDLKPANIFLARQDDQEIVKVLDFGIAKTALTDEEGITQTGTLVGTPHYMSPEQARRTNKLVDHRSDLWSVGVIAYRALTGKLPFAGNDIIDVLLRVCSEPVPPATSVAPDLDPEVDLFFERALAREPEGRFQSAREMADALGELAGRLSIADDAPPSVSSGRLTPTYASPARAVPAAPPAQPQASALPAQDAPPPAQAAPAMLSPRDKRTVFFGSTRGAIAPAAVEAAPPAPQGAALPAAPDLPPAAPIVVSSSLRRSGPLVPMPMPVPPAPQGRHLDALANGGDEIVPTRLPSGAARPSRMWIAGGAVLVVVVIVLSVLATASLRSSSAGPGSASTPAPSAR